MPPEPDIYTFPEAVEIAVQTGILDQEWKNGLQSSLAYGRTTIPETIAINMGQTLTFTRNAERTPQDDPKPTTQYAQNLNNGHTPSTSGVEQYTLGINNYSDLTELDLMSMQAGFKGRFIREINLLGKQAAQSRDRVCRNEYFNCYMGGQTTVITGGTLSTTTAHVDDIRGFQKVLNAKGEMKDVSGSDTLTAYEINPSTGAVVRTLTITGSAADDPNVSSVAYNGKKYGISGQVTYSTAGAAPAAGNLIVAFNAPKMFRPKGKLGTRSLTGGDNYSSTLVQNVVAYLRNQGTPPNADGFYHVYHNATSEQQMLADPIVQLAFQGQASAEELRRGVLFEWGGVKFFTTTESPIQDHPTTAGLQVHRPLVVGGEAMVEADWQGLDGYLAMMTRGIHAITRGANNQILILRPPIDAFGRMLSAGWYWPSGVCCGTDMKATSLIIPTANSNALYKRAAVIEHV